MLRIVSELQWLKYGLCVGEREPDPEPRGRDHSRGGGEHQEPGGHLKIKIQDGGPRGPLDRTADGPEADAGAGEAGNKDDGTEALPKKTGRKKSENQAGGLLNIFNP